MKLAFFSLFAFIANFTFSQSLENQQTFYLMFADSQEFDSTYHAKIVNEKWAFFDKDSNQIFTELFDNYPTHIGASYFKVYNNTGNFIVNTKTKKIFQLDSKYKTRYDFGDLSLVVSSMSKDTLIKLKNDFINFKNEIIIDGEIFTSNKNYKKEGVPFVKGYSIKDELDLFFEDEGYFDQMDTSEYDDGIRDNIFIQKNKNAYLKNLVFDEANAIDEELYFQVSHPFNGFNERYFIVKKNGKYGIISTLGKTILPFEFSSINPIFQEQLISFGHHVIFEAKRNNIKEIYNSSGQYMFSSNYIDEYEYMEFYGNFSYGYYEGLVTRNKSNVGLISLSGIEVIPTKYDSYDVLNFNSKELIKEEKNTNKSISCAKYEYEQYFIGLNNDNYDFYAPNGKFLNHFEIDGVESYNKKGYIAYYKGDFYGLIGPGACTVLEPKYQYISSFLGERDIFSVQEDTISYFVNGKGEKLFKGEISGDFVDGSYAVAYKNGAYGLMDVENSLDTIHWAIQPKYEAIEKLNVYGNNYERYFLVKLNNKYGLVTDSDKEYLPIVYDQVSLINSLMITVKDGKYGLENFYFSNGAKLLPNEYDKIDYLKFNLIAVQKGNKIALYHQLDKKLISGFDYDAIDNIPSNYYYFFIKKDGKNGVMDENGKITIDPIYTSIKFDAVSKEYECLKENGQKDCIFAK